MASNSGECHVLVGFKMSMIVYCAEPPRFASRTCISYLASLTHSVRNPIILFILWDIALAMILRDIFNRCLVLSVSIDSEHLRCWIFLLLLL